MVTCKCHGVGIKKPSCPVRFQTGIVVIQVAEDNFQIRYNEGFGGPLITRGPMNTIPGPIVPVVTLLTPSSEPAPNQIVGSWTRHDNLVSFNFNIVYAINNGTLNGSDGILSPMAGIARFILRNLPAPVNGSSSISVFMDTDIGTPSPMLLDDVYDTVGEIRSENGITYMTIRYLVRDVVGNTDIKDQNLLAGSQHIRGHGTYLTN